MKKKQDNISVVHLAEYNLPTITEQPNRDWIQFGDDNLYPQYLLELYNGSSINNAIIKGVSAMIYGEGLDATDREESDTKKESWLALNGLLHNSSKDVLKCLAFDLKLFGMCYVNAIWNRPRTKIIEIRHIPAQYMRSGKADAYGKVNDYYYSSDWTNTRKNKPRYYKGFDLKDRSDANQVLCIKDYSPGSFYYSTPDYQGSTSYIQLDMEIAQFHLNNIKAGMFPSMAVNFANGIPTQEERRTIERQINAKFSGSSNAGRILLTFNDSRDTAPEIIPINSNDNAESYQFLSTETTRKVLTGHRVVSGLLFGVKSGEGSGFGNNADELSDSFSLFLNTVVKPFQNTLLDGLEPILHANDINLDLYFKTLKPADFINVESVSQISEDEQEKEGIDTGEEIKKEFSELSEDSGEVLLSNLESTEIDLDEWFELGEIDVEDGNSDTEQKFEQFSNEHLSKHYEFANASKIPSNPDSPNSDSNAGFIRVLYRYSQNIASDSRSFCKQMVNLSKGGTLYTINNLKQASNLSVNKGFGKRGASTYDVFQWKGGIYCHHYFVRKFFVRKRVPKGSEVTIAGKTYKAGAYLPNGSLDMFKRSFLKEVSSGRFASSWKKIKVQEPKGPSPTIAPINTPTRGKYS